MKSIALVTSIAGAVIAALLVLPVLFIFIMSFDDSKNNTDLKTWLARSALLSLPLIVAAVDFIAWRAYLRGDYELTLKIGVGFAVLLLIGLFSLYY